MTKTLFCILFLAFFCGAASAQTKLKKGDRPVFYSAQKLAHDCRDALSINHGNLDFDNNEAYSVSKEQLIGATTCAAYINGVYDESLESLGSHYNPIPASMGFRQTLVNTFVKYVSDHPEEEDFAASTVLARVAKIIANVQKPH